MAYAELYLQPVSYWPIQVQKGAKNPGISQFSDGLGPKTACLAVKTLFPRSKWTDPAHRIRPRFFLRIFRKNRGLTTTTEESIRNARESIRSFHWGIFRLGFNFAVLNHVALAHATE